MVANLRRPLAAAEKEFKALSDKLAPLEAAIAECQGRLDTAVSFVQIGSAIQLDDIDELQRREREQVRLGRAMCVCVSSSGSLTVQAAPNAQWPGDCVGIAGAAAEGGGQPPGRNQGHSRPLRDTAAARTGGVCNPPICPIVARVFFFVRRFCPLA